MRLEDHSTTSVVYETINKQVADKGIEGQRRIETKEVSSLTLFHKSKAVIHRRKDFQAFNAARWIINQATIRSGGKESFTSIPSLKWHSSDDLSRDFVTLNSSPLLSNPHCQIEDDR